jgi:hypothetical protein
MITRIEPIAVGNALRLFLEPATGAVYGRVLRRTADAFTGYNDTGAVLIADRVQDNNLVDVAALTNGTTYFYHSYSFDGAVWSDDGPSVTGTPAATYDDASVDPLSVVLDRLSAGMAIEVARGKLQPQSNSVPVINAPFMLSDGPKFPVVSVHLESSAPDVRAVGEVIDEDDLIDGQVISGEAWIERTRLNIVAASLNPDERLALRLSVGRVLKANLPVFDSLGMMTVEWSTSDMEDTEAYSAPLYMTAIQFSCLSVAGVTAPTDPITEIQVTGSAYFPGDNHV